jgi:cytidine deaminase
MITEEIKSAQVVAVANETKYSPCPSCKKILRGVKQEDEKGYVRWRFYCDVCHIGY